MGHRGDRKWSGKEGGKAKQIETKIQTVLATCELTNLYHCHSADTNLFCKEKTASFICWWAIQSYWGNICIFFNIVKINLAFGIFYSNLHNKNYAKTTNKKINNRLNKAMKKSMATVTTKTHVINEHISHKDNMKAKERKIKCSTDT